MVDLFGLGFTTKRFNKVCIFMAVMASDYIDLVLIVILNFVTTFRMILKKDSVSDWYEHVFTSHNFPVFRIRHLDVLLSALICLQKLF